MLYSQWDPARGGYSYFETPEQLPFGADLPVSRLSDTTEIGVASVVAGRPLPSEARYVGQGELGRGMIVPMQTGGMLGALSLNTRDAVLAAIGVLGGLWLSVWWRKRR